jgi:hypothetical protein
MTTPRPPYIAPPPWDENRFREVLRRHKPYTPRVRAALEHLVHCTREFDRADQEYALNAALTGAQDLSLPALRLSIRRLARARRKALIALGEDPGMSDLLPAVPVMRHDA